MNRKKTFLGVKILSCHLECVSFGPKFYQYSGFISQKTHYFPSKVMHQGKKLCSMCSTWNIFFHFFLHETILFTGSIIFFIFSLIFFFFYCLFITVFSIISKSCNVFCFLIIRRVEPFPSLSHSIIFLLFNLNEWWHVIVYH